MGRTLKKACDQLLCSFEKMQRETERQHRERREERVDNGTDVMGRANRAMRLIQTKRKIVEEMDVLKQSPGVYEDELLLLGMQLRNISAEIKKHIEV